MLVCRRKTSSSLQIVLFLILMKVQFGLFWSQNVFFKGYSAVDFYSER
jgi:hypothetical protein